MKRRKFFTHACETGKTGGWLLQAPAAFFHRLAPKHPKRITPILPQRMRPTLATQIWLITWQHRNGDVQTRSVLISGVWQVAEIETRARDALYLQHDISNAKILRLSLDLTMTSVRQKASQDITTKEQRRLHFESECG